MEDLLGTLRKYGVRSARIRREKDSAAPLIEEVEFFATDNRAVIEDVHRAVEERLLEGLSEQERQEYKSKLHESLLYHSS